MESRHRKNTDVSKLIQQKTMGFPGRKCWVFHRNLRFYYGDFGFGKAYLD
jgi:hypothetical protein